MERENLKGDRPTAQDMGNAAINRESIPLAERIGVAKA